MDVKICFITNGKEKIVQISRIPSISEYLVVDDTEYTISNIINDADNDEIIVFVKDILPKESTSDDSNGDISKLLIAFQEEYKTEQSKLNNTFTRAGFMLAFLSGLVIYFNQIIELSKLREYSFDDIIKSFIVITLIGTFVLALISLIIGIYYFVKVINIEKFSKLDFSDFNAEDPLKSFNTIEHRLFENYKDILISNEKIVENKALQLKKGYFYTFICVGSIFINVLINKLI